MNFPMYMHESSLNLFLFSADGFDPRFKFCSFDCLNLERNLIIPSGFSPTDIREMVVYSYSVSDASRRTSIPSSSIGLLSMIRVVTFVPNTVISYTTYCIVAAFSD